METMERLMESAQKAWDAFCRKDYGSLDVYGAEVYNYFVHHPIDILNLKDPLLFGKVFQVCLGFRNVDQDIQEVRAENAFICFAQVLDSDEYGYEYDKTIEAAARLMLLLIKDQEYLIHKVAEACTGENYNPMNILSALDDGLPFDMPVATNTKMLYTAYYVYNIIEEESNVSSLFSDFSESASYINVERHIVNNCNRLTNSTPARKVELGGIVFDKIEEKIREDISRFAEEI